MSNLLFRSRTVRDCARLIALASCVFALQPAMASPSPVAGTSANATVAGTSPVTMHFPLTRSGDSAYAAWIHYATQNGTALAGTDYTATSGAIKVPAGATGATIPVQILGASNPSADKSFTMKLLDAVGVGPIPAFSAQQTFAAGTYPNAVASADINGDGKPDLIVSNQGNGSVSVLLNTTAPGATIPSFAAQKSFATGSYPNSVTAADLNGDGKPDLIIANAGGNSVSVLLNTTAPGASTPSFTAQQTFATGNSPDSVAVADVNGDGKPDLIVANYASHTVSVLLNTTAPGATTPSFAAQQTFSAGNGPYSVTAADVNGDGKPDLIVTNYTSNTVSVLLNTTVPGASTPSFAAQQTFATGNAPSSVTAVDVNGDGKPDLVVANYGSNTVSVLLNTTAPGAVTPNFAAPHTFAANAPRSITAADLNGDGKPDLIVANYSSNTVSVLLNTTAPGATAPSFAAQQAFAAGNGTHSVVAADVNGDGKPDLIVANFTSNNISVLLNTTASPTASAPSYTALRSFTAGNGAYSTATADLNGDGKPDLITTNNNADTVSVFFNTTAPGASVPSFAPQQTFATGGHPYEVTTADINGDGKPDLIVANSSSNTVSILLNTTAPGAATPSFATQQTFATGNAPYVVTTADVNGDGKPDLIVANFQSNDVSVLLNTTPPGATTVSFAAQQTFAVGTHPISITTADINGDGKPDLIVSNYSSSNVSVLLNTTPPGATTPTFAAQQTFATGSVPYSVTTADVNGDGKPDLITSNYLGYTVSVLLNTTAPGAATPSFAPQKTFPTGSHPDFVTTADVNGDGKPDVVVTNYTSNTVSMLLNTTAPGASTPNFAAQQTFAVGSYPAWITETDINTDGKPDFAVVNGYNNTVSVLLDNQYAASVSPASVTGTIHYAIPQVSLSPNPVAFGNVVAGNIATKPLTLSNTGSASLSVASFSISGTNTARFSQSNNCPTSLAPGASCIINVSYTPNALTTDNATLSVSSSAPSSPDTVALTGTGIDHAPTANNGTLLTSTNTAAGGTLSATNPDSNQTLTYSIVTQPTHGTVTITNASTGAYTYTPATGYAGSDAFTFKANDGYLDSNTATVSVTVADTPPTAIGANLSTPTNQALSGQLQGNANDAGQTLTFALAQAPAHGAVTVKANGQFSYTPATGFAGNDAFSFTVNDGYLTSAPATVAITVNDTAPTAANVSFSTPLNTAHSGQLQASNPDSGQTLTYAVVSQPSHGSVTVNAGTGAYTYTPNSGYIGSDSFTFKVNDGYRDSNTATVSATVTDQPPVAQNASYKVAANRSVSGQLKASTSSSSQTLTYASVSQPAHGSLSLDPATGQFTYIPTHNYTGSDSFTFKASDGTLDSNTATVTLKVAAGSLAVRGGAGGGAFGPWGLALLAGLVLLITWLRRKRFSQKPSPRGTQLAALALTGVLLGAGLLTAVPARAAGAWYVGLQANVIKPAGGRDSATAGFNGWTALIGRHLGTHFAVEFDRAYYSDNPRTLTATANWVNWGLRGLYFPWKSNGAFAPFLLAGIGHQYEYRGDNSEPSNNSVSLGLGFTSRPWRAPIAIRAEVEAQHGFGGGYTDRIASLGVMFGFGAPH